MTDNVFDAIGYWEFVRKYMGPGDPHIDMEVFNEQVLLYMKSRPHWEPTRSESGIGTELHEFVEKFNTVVASEEVFCPFAKDFVCPADCPSLRERACIIGEDDE